MILRKEGENTLPIPCCLQIPFQLREKHIDRYGFVGAVFSIFTENGTEVINPFAFLSAPFFYPLLRNPVI